MRLSKYRSPIIERAEQAMEALKKEKKYNNDRSPSLKIEFTDRYERIMQVVRGEENRIAFDNGDWKNRREFTNEMDGAVDTEQSLNDNQEQVELGTEGDIHHT